MTTQATPDRDTPDGDIPDGDTPDGAGYRSPLLDLPGAVAAEGVDAGTAWHYGDPGREQRYLEEGLGVVDLSHRGVVTVTGPDRLTWLHSLTTQHLSELAAGTSVEAMVLSPHGHVEHVLHVVDDGVTTWLTVEPGTAGPLVAWLDRMRFLSRVEVADVSRQWAVVGEARSASAAPGEPPVWVDPWPRTAPGSAAYGVPDDRHVGRARPWREVLVPRADLAAEVVDRPPVGTWAAEAVRVAAARPRHLFETDHRTIPHEADWLRSAVHLAKGCYRGQETVARVHNLGRPPRRLALLHLDGSDHALPPRGAAVRRADDPAAAVGFVTTVARHAELGPVALALLKRKVPGDAGLAVDAGPGGGRPVAASQDTLGLA
ncbi:MAG: YgfZ/GcvT domain-containing protein [Kineosporiaceae bacterium]